VKALSLSSLALIAVPALAAAPATTASPAPAATVPPPALRKIERNDANVGYRVKIRPGVPKAGETVTIEIELAQLLTESDPTYGKRKPIDDADLRAILVGPSPKKGKAATWSAAHRPVRLADSGTYGVTFTPASAGVYGLYLRGSAGDLRLEFQANLPVATWPVAEDAPFAALPSPEPELADGNAAHGRAVCAERCKKDHPAALPKGDVPAYLASDVAESLSDNALLAQLLPDANLDPMERADLLFYLRSLHLAIRDLFPDAAVILAQPFTINEHGKQRLLETANIKLDDTQARATVFTIYKGDKASEPKHVAYDDRVSRDRLQKSDKLGYVVFLSLPNEPKAYELALGLGLEPTYPIIKLVGRAQSGARDAAFNKQLAGLTGLGRFNDAKSLAKGPAGLRDKLLPVYLRAAELATMYYADEREFTAFDSEFGASAAEPTPTAQPTIKKTR
jgi:hypothetical protein